MNYLGTLTSYLNNNEQNDVGYNYVLYIWLLQMGINKKDKLH